MYYEARTLDTNTAKAFVSAYDGKQSVEQYYTGFMGIYGSARKGMSQAKAVASSLLGARLSEPQQYMAYVAGQNAGKLTDVRKPASASFDSQTVKPTLPDTASSINNQPSEDSQGGEVRTYKDKNNADHPASEHVFKYLERISDKRKAQISTPNENTVFVETNDDLISHVRSALTGTEKKNIHIGIIPASTVNRINDSIENVPRSISEGVLNKNKQYSLEISYDSIRHLRNEHKYTSNEIEKYLLILPQIISEFDTVHFSWFIKGKNRQRGLRFKKKMGGNPLIAYELVSKKRNVLSLKTDFEAMGRDTQQNKEPGASAKSQQRNGNTSETSRPSALNPNVSHQDSSVKGNVPEAKDQNVKKLINLNTEKQKIKSGSTSINAAKLPAVFNRVKFQPGTVNLDLGGGKFDNATEYLVTQGVTNYIIDPDNRSQEHNEAAAAATQDGQADTVTISNVLNVIKEQEVRSQVLANAVDAVKPNGTVYITIYEGNGTGKGKISKYDKENRPESWQENRPMSSYLKEVRKFFGDVTVKNRVIIAKKPQKTAVLNAYGDSAAVAKWTTTRVGLSKKTMPISDIVEMIRHDFKLPVTTGHIRGRKILGQYDTRAQGIRSRGANDLPTIAHELGHHLDNLYSITQNLRSALQNELLDPLPAEFGENYAINELLGEGFAEYIRKYLQNRETTAMDYPQFTQHFIDALDTKALELVNRHADEINAYYALDTDTAESSIRLRHEGPRDFRAVGEKVADKGDMLYQAWVDSNHGIRLFDKATGARTYVLASNSAYADSIAYNILTGDLTDINGGRVSAGLTDVLKGIDTKNRKEYIAFAEYLVARHGPERLKEGQRIFADDKKNSTQWMENRQAQLERQYPKFKAAADNLYKFQSDFLKTWGVKTNLVTSDEADAWADRWKYYVPFNRALAIDSRLIGAKRGYANQKSPIKRSRGSGADIIHPVDNIINNMVLMINTAIRNNVSLNIADVATSVDATARFLEQVPEPLVRKETNITAVKDKLVKEIQQAGFSAEDTEKAFGIIGDLDSVLVQYERGKEHGDVIAILRNGTPEYWKVNDPQLLESLTNLTPATTNAIIEAYGRISRFMSANITGNNVIWSLFSNMPRDIMTMFTYAENKNPIKLFGGMASAYLNKMRGMKADPMYKEFLGMGGGQTSAYTADKNLAKTINNKIKGGKLSWLNPLEWVEYASNMIEAGPRFAYYKVMREKGLSSQEAFYASAEITTNFRRRSVNSRTINQFVPFFNASVQGLDRFRRWITASDIPREGRKKAVFARATMYFTASAALAALMWALNGGDDELKKDYAQLSNYTKNNFFCIPLGDGKYFTIPKPREIGVLNSFMEACLEQGGGNQDALEGFYEYATNNLLPSFTADVAQLDFGGAAGSFGIFGTVMYMLANRDFTGKPIVSTNLQKYEPKDQYTDRTSAIAYAIGQAFNVSPNMVDYFFQQTLGGFWRAQKALFPIGGENVDLTLGVQSTYVRDNQYSTDVIDKIYAALDMTTKAKNSDPEDIMKAILYKEADNITTFYSRYNKLAKGLPESMLARATRQTVLNMAMEFNKVAESGDRTLYQERLDDMCEAQGNTDIMIAAMQPYITDSDKVRHELTASQYVQFQTEYNSLYWQYVGGVLNGASPSAEAVKSAKEQALTEAKGKLLKLMGVSDKTTQKYDGMMSAGVSSNDNILFQTALDVAKADGSLKKEEVIDALDNMASLTDAAREYLYDQQYSTADLTNPYRTAEGLNNEISESLQEGRTDKSIKSSITNAYKDEVIRLYEAGDNEGIQEIIDKLGSLDLQAKKGGPYFTYNYVWSWIHDHYNVKGTGEF